MKAGDNSNHWPAADARPKVSVMLTAYNHEPFIAQAIDSTLSQEASFRYEVVIGEDCSTDGTRDIVIRYQRKCPDKIRLVLSEKNSSECHNIGRTLAACRGEYVAMLDGDDFWISRHKLQRQADFLDSHPDFAISCHNAISFYEDGSKEPYYFNPVYQKETSTLDDLWGGNFIATCSVMFRARFVRQLPDWFFGLTCGDWPLFILCAQQGKIGYISDAMGAYRVHSGGAWSGLSEVEQYEQVIEFYKQMNTNLNFAYDEIIKAMIARHYSELAGIHERTGNLAAARVCLQMGMS